MLGRKDYTREELDHAKAAVDAQLAAYKNLLNAIGSGTSDPEVTSAIEAFEPLFFNNMTLVLDRYFVHRLRAVTGKDGNPLNEVELLTESPGPWQSRGLHQMSEHPCPWNLAPGLHQRGRVASGHDPGKRSFASRFGMSVYCPPGS